MFFNRFYLQSNWSTKLFVFGLNLELQEASKSEAPKIKFIISKLLRSKNPGGFVTETFKTGITNPQGFFDLSNFYLIKLNSEPLTLRPPCSSRLRSNEKFLVDQLPWGQICWKTFNKEKLFWIDRPYWSPYGISINKF